MAVATYRYAFGGHTYEGTRVGLENAYDNVGSWQRDQYTPGRRETQRARHRRVGGSGESRSIGRRPKPASGDGCFRDPLRHRVSVGVVQRAVDVDLGPADAGTSKPWCQKNPHRTKEIRSDARSSARMSWAFAIFWSLIAFPVAFEFVPDLYGRSPMWLVVMLFPIVGLFLIWAAAARDDPAPAESATSRSD